MGDARPLHRLGERHEHRIPLVDPRDRDGRRRERQARPAPSAADVEHRATSSDRGPGEAVRRRVVATSASATNRPRRMHPRRRRRLIEDLGWDRPRRQRLPPPLRRVGPRRDRPRPRHLPNARRPNRSDVIVDSTGTRVRARTRVRSVSPHMSPTNVCGDTDPVDRRGRRSTCRPDHRRQRWSEVCHRRWHGASSVQRIVGGSGSSATLITADERVP